MKSNLLRLIIMLSTQVKTNRKIRRDCRFGYFWTAIVLVIDCLQAQIWKPKCLSAVCNELFSVWFILGTWYLKICLHSETVLYSHSSWLRKAQF